MNTRFAIGLAILILASACSGGGSGSSTTPPPPAHAAPSLAYQDPTGEGWKLVRDYSSTSTRLVLNLVGPSGLKARGVGFNLQKGAGLTFATFANGAYANDTGVFELKGSNANFEPYAGTDADPVLFVSAPLAAGDVLSTGIFQKDRSYPAKALTQPLVQIVLEVAQGLAGPGSAAGGLGLKVVKARMIPDDIGGMDFQLTPTVIAKAKLLDIDIAVGTVTYQ
jgi:hypothetical protein